MVQVTQGRLCKQIAADIGVAEGTVKVHRSRLMRKMKAGSLPELSRMADKLKLIPEKAGTFLILGASSSWTLPMEPIARRNDNGLSVSRQSAP
jgi:hypothetical protein